MTSKRSSATRALRLRLFPQNCGRPPNALTWALSGLCPMPGAVALALVVVAVGLAVAVRCLKLQLMLSIRTRKLNTKTLRPHSFSTSILLMGFHGVLFSPTLVWLKRSPLLRRPWGLTAMTLCRPPHPCGTQRFCTRRF